MNNKLMKGQVVELTKSITYNDTKIELFMKAEVMAVGAKESLILVDNIQEERKINVYVPNNLIKVQVEDILWYKDLIKC